MSGFLKLFTSLERSSSSALQVDRGITFLTLIIRYAYLLEGDRILLCLVDSQENVIILLDLLSHIDAAIQCQSYAKFIHNDILGGTRLFAFDESKRMLAVYASARVCLSLCQIPADR
jgi:hypothetical protein